MSKTIVCFGDSNTHGYCAATNGRYTEKERWPRLLQEKLGEDYLVIEEGLSGRTTVFEDPLFEGLNGLSSIYQCLMSHEPVDLLIIMLGTNDVKQRFNATPANIAKGMSRLVQKALSAQDAWKTVPNILIMAPPPIQEAYYATPIGAEMGAGCAEKSEQLAFYYEQVAGLLKCHFINAGALAGVTMSEPDYMHLSAAAHEALATHLTGIVPNLIP